MSKQLFIPLRFKILVTLLLGITVVVGAITFTMANLFHTDKTAYINDLISSNTIHTAQEAKSMVQIYYHRIKAISRVAYDTQMTPDEKAKILDDLFQDFPEMLAINFYQDDIKTVSIFDEQTLTDVGLSKADLDIYLMDNSILLIHFDPGGVFIRNSTFNKVLPIMTMATRIIVPGLDADLVIEALIRTDKLMALVGRSELFEAFILEPDGRFLIHKDTEPIASHRLMEWVPDSIALPEQSNLAATFEYAIGGVDMIGGFTRLELGNLIVAAQIPKSAAFLSAKTLFNNLIVTSFIILLAAATISLIWSYRITRPLVNLTRAAQEVGRGKFEIQLDPTSRDEIGSLTQSVNQMAQELGEREKALQDANAALIQSEKMSAFGQLSAGIAHEVKNPLAGILGYTQLSLKKTDDDSALFKNLKIIEQETRRCNAIIENLMKFARQDNMELTPLVLNSVIEDSMVLVDHQMGINQITLEKDLADDLPEVMGESNQLIQVLMNLLINAQQAMEGTHGTIRITSKRLNADSVEITVADTGPGMPPETAEKIFEPFFTTKAVGKGTGLGLAVTYGIIKDHGGEIRVESKPGEGATFIITLPVATSDASGDVSPEPPDLKRPDTGTDGVRG
jgi:two-component system NtrC family sensor kinase